MGKAAGSPHSTGLVEADPRRESRGRQPAQEKQKARSPSRLAAGFLKLRDYRLQLSVRTLPREPNRHSPEQQLFANAANFIWPAILAQAILPVKRVLNSTVLSPGLT